MCDKYTKDEQVKILQQAHEYGHNGSVQLFKHIVNTLGYYWPSIRTDCAKEVKGCLQCLQFNIARHGYHPLTPITALIPMDHLAIDLHQFSQTSEDGNTYLMAVVDVCTRFTFLYALSDKSMSTVASTLAALFQHFGVPRIIQSDNGSEFKNELIKEVAKILHIDWRYITPYHPQANGLVERHIGIVQNMVNKVNKGDTYHWDYYIPRVQLAVNNRILNNHNSTPFALMFNRPFLQSNVVDPKAKHMSPSQISTRWKKLESVIFPALQQQQDYDVTSRKHQFDKKKTVSKELPLNTKVAKLEDTLIKQKSKPKYSGPYSIAEITKGGAYRLINDLGELLPISISRNKLKVLELPDKPWPITPVTNSVLTSDNDNTFELDRILAHRGSPSNWEYLVTWKSPKYKGQKDWIAESDINTHLILEEYWHAQGTLKSKKRSTHDTSIEHKSSKKVKVVSTSRPRSQSRRGRM